MASFFVLERIITSVKIHQVKRSFAGNFPDDVADLFGRFDHAALDPFLDDGVCAGIAVSGDEPASGR